MPISIFEKNGQISVAAPPRGTVGPTWCPVNRSHLERWDPLLWGHVAPRLNVGPGQSGPQEMLGQSEPTGKARSKRAHVGPISCRSPIVGSGHWLARLTWELSQDGLPLIKFDFDR